MPQIKLGERSPARVSRLSRLCHRLRAATTRVGYEAKKLVKVRTLNTHCNERAPGQLADLRARSILERWQFTMFTDTESAGNVRPGV